MKTNKKIMYIGWLLCLITIVYAISFHFKAPNTIIFYGIYPIGISGILLSIYGGIIMKSSDDKDAQRSRS